MFHETATFFSNYTVNRSRNSIIKNNIITLITPSPIMVKYCVPIQTSTAHIFVCLTGFKKFPYFLRYHLHT